MCTSIALTTKDTYTGRNLDLEYAFGEKVVITPWQFPLQFHKMPTLETHQAIIGMASVAEGYPLYAEGVNESGVYMAGLNFPGNAYYPPEGGTGEALAPYELIPWLLGTCKTAAEAAEQMQRIPLLGVPFGPNMPLAPLHWHIADRQGAFVAEPMTDGVKVYPDPVGVLTNNPPFPFHRTNLTQYRGLSAAQPENTLDPALSCPPSARVWGQSVCRGTGPPPPGMSGRRSASATASAKTARRAASASSSTCWTRWPCPGARCEPPRGTAISPGIPAASIPLPAPITTRPTTTAPLPPWR